MQYKLLEEHPKTYALIFGTGAQLAEGLKQFAIEQKIRGASFKAMGALSSVRLGWFNWQTKKYETAAHGGHLLEATVRPTCELMLTESPEHLRKEIDAESGIALIRL